MSQTTIPQETDGARPPMPKVMFLIANPLMKLMLRSPFHGRVSDNLMLLTITGRKSGKRYTIPVGYVRDENSDILVFTHSPWWKNLKGGAPVTMRIQGRDLPGIAVPVNDYQDVKHMVTRLNQARGKEMSQRMGFYIANPDPSPEEVAAATKGTIFIRIREGG